ncbi:MAG: alginate O-acetyltransferase [Nevskia sp.]|nr:alginate O-acetyltransferase [Nevskia sp.]
MRTNALHAALFSIFVLLTSMLALHRSGSMRLHADQALLRGEPARAFETQYDQAFPAKTFGVNLWAAIDYELFGEGHAGVVIGREHWLYTDEEFRLENDADATLARNLALIVWLRDRLAEKNVRLLIARVPEKASIYPEFVGAHAWLQLHRELPARIGAALDAAHIANVELAQTLRDGKAQQPTFLRTDTHWTPFGAQLAAQAIGNAVAKLDLRFAAPTDFRQRREACAAHRGDLFTFLPLDPYFSWLLPPPDCVEAAHTEATSTSSELFGDAPPPQIALVGTSYSANPLWDFPGALQQALHQPISNYATDGLGPFAPLAVYLQSADWQHAPPQLVIWELPERYLPTAQHLDAYHVPATAFTTP